MSKRSKNYRMRSMQGAAPSPVPYPDSPIVPRRFMTGIVSVILIVILAVFLFSLFKNIQYPLLWNDEAETAMFAERILEFGYPKAHDGKNVLMLLELPDTSLGVNKKMDAYTASTWGQYYFAVPGVLFARMAADIYMKTALIRIPFALAGIAGLALFGAAAYGVFGPGDKHKGVLCLVAFGLLELFSTGLQVHLREVRSYAPALCFLALLVYLYVRRAFLRTGSFVSYCAAVAVASVALFTLFTPAYAAFSISLVAYECFSFMFGKKKLAQSLANICPVALSTLITVPLYFFHKLGPINAAFKIYFAAHCNGNWASVYVRHLLTALTFFSTQEFLIPLVMVKALTVILWAVFGASLRAQPAVFFERIANGRRLSSFLSLLLVSYLLVVPTIPFPFIFERYFIGLQPVIALILVLDVWLIWELYCSIGLAVLGNAVLAAVAVISGLLIGPVKAQTFQNHTYEMFHQYKGPLDFIIPYIKTAYAKPQDLVIATNYEECAYMYYLGSKAIVGYVGNNLAEDMLQTPDIISPRKTAFRTNRYLESYQKKAFYKRILFPVEDSHGNNLPESRWHRYETAVTDVPAKAVEIYVRE